MGIQLRQADNELVIQGIIIWVTVLELTFLKIHDVQSTTGDYFNQELFQQLALAVQSMDMFLWKHSEL